MFREDLFLISRKPYAVDLATLRGKVVPTPNGRRPSYFDGRIDAVWFRRKQGVNVACIGHLWDLQDHEPADGSAFLTAHADGRYGGTCHGRWDGDSYWGNVTLTVQEQHLEVLRPMLANYPDLPPGYDGWWRF